MRCEAGISGDEQAALCTAALGSSHPHACIEKESYRSLRSLIYHALSSVEPVREAAFPDHVLGQWTQDALQPGQQSSQGVILQFSLDPEDMYLVTNLCRRSKYIATPCLQKKFKCPKRKKQCDTTQTTRKSIAMSLQTG